MYMLIALTFYLRTPVTNLSIKENLLIARGNLALNNTVKSFLLKLYI